MLIELRLDDSRWVDVGLQDLADGAFRMTLDHLDLAAGDVEISLLGCDDPMMCQLNADFRDKPQPTNVLSWPEDMLASQVAGGRPHPPRPDPEGALSLGDIAISYDTCAREAAAGGKTLADHVTHLLVHGLLHLLGYDHIDEADAALMERLETEILGRMGLDDPYSVTG